MTFNNHAGSTKSYDWGRGHEGQVHEVGFVPSWTEPDVEFKDGESVAVPLPDGGTVVIKGSLTLFVVCLVDVCAFFGGGGGERAHHSHIARTLQRHRKRAHKTLIRPT